MKPRAKKMKPFNQGMTLCYIGDGKGKTTAAIGTAVRARGYGWKVLYFQFMKSSAWPSGERTALTKLGITVQVHGEGFVGILGDTKPKKEHKKAAQEALKKAVSQIRSGLFNLVVLDEIISCIEVGLFSQTEVSDFLQQMRKNAKAKKTHLILTGHTKYPRIIKHCDLVTDMRMVKHPYYKGYLALKGIDF